MLDSLHLSDPAPQLTAERAAVPKQDPRAQQAHIKKPAANPLLPSDVCVHAPPHVALAKASVGIDTVTPRLPQATNAHMAHVLTLPWDLGHYLDKADAYNLAAVFPRSARHILGPTFHRRSIARHLEVSDTWLSQRFAQRSHLLPAQGPRLGAYLATVHQAFNRMAAHAQGQGLNEEAIDTTVAFITLFAPEVLGELRANTLHTAAYQRMNASIIEEGSRSAALLGCFMGALFMLGHGLATLTVKTQSTLDADGRGMGLLFPPVFGFAHNRIKETLCALVSETNYARGNALCLGVALGAVLNFSRPHVAGVIDACIMYRLNQDIYARLLASNALHTLAKVTQDKS